ncbi:hypothetical protein TorRG33x02_190900 [Trema orientale]|uniref:Uncharacterized protein n=1 Tax=Trema orientale TaxID=63057 RepID=A0A2P5EHU6_TREOI|nr:hypothetical protein TorRG33x02_190900 [Trema orientale]
MFRVGFSLGREAKTAPFSMRASWTSFGSLRMMRVRVPILRVRMGPYWVRRSRTYSKKGFPERTTWKRFPTMGQPGGPGGRLGRFDLVFWVRRKIRPEMRKARRVKKRW